MGKVAVVIPNYNGAKYLKECLLSLNQQTCQEFRVIIVDNCSEDDYQEEIRKYQGNLELSVLELDQNYGFSKAVNQGILACQEDYVILLNNDTNVGTHFVEKLVEAMEESEDIFSAQALMLHYQEHSVVDSAGDFFTILGWGFARGKDRLAVHYQKTEDIFSACAGAAIYRRKILEEIGLFDETFFAYLEDVDLGYRARLYGYRNVFAPEAKVLHVGSGVSGSRHNAFKVSLSARNAILVIYKNFSDWQLVLNSLPIVAGILIKLVYFARKDLGRAYLEGVFSGFSRLGKTQRCNPPVKPSYGRIQWELMKNTIRRTGFFDER